MSPALKAVAPGPYVTIQDTGRAGWRRFGVSGCGAMDLPSLTAANALVGNTADAAALEFAHVGGAWEVLADSMRIAVAGGDFAIELDGVPLQSWRSHTLRRGQVFLIKGAPDAVWGYLAVAQGFDVAPQLGSRATHLRSRLGGLDGARIAEGDVLPLCASHAPPSNDRQLQPHAYGPEPIRVVLGPQDDYFPPDAIATFLAATYRVSHRSDRMGTWLDGPAIAHAGDYNVVSDGLVPGCVQIPGAGTPVVLMMDCQTIGGYPKLATIITADLPRFAQRRAGSAVCFALVEIDMAQLLYREYRAGLAAIGQSVQEVPGRTSLPFWLRG